MTGKVQNYEKGSIYWSSGSPNKAVALWGELLREYLAMNGPKSFLGHPKKREYDWNGGKRANFDGGYLYWNGYFSQAFKYNEIPPPYTPPTPIPPTPIPVPLVPTYLPGTGLVPANAGTFLGKVEATSGVVMHYYQSGYLVEQPGNRLYWYASPSGAGFNPVQRVTNKPTPLIDPVATTIMESAINLFDDPKRDQYTKGGGFPSSKSGKVGGATGKTAYYKFTLEGLRDINFKLSGLSADADLKLWSPDTNEFYSIRKSGKSVEEFRRICRVGNTTWWLSRWLGRQKLHSGWMWMSVPPKRQGTLQGARQ
ncbi:MAG: hypothetical protein HC916_15515 [Coleofasciculaceae cyanobacterium SM2_1_6]|nr:hypothetical protein [Coleofasciculaceae cyanobacterium SM2_1_6]